MSGSEIAVRDASLDSLDGLAAIVEREHAEVVLAISEALHHALVAGDALLRAQTELRDEPSFSRWVEARGLHYRTAQKYMRLATYREQLMALPEFGGLSMTRAHLYLRGLPRRSHAEEEKEVMVAEIKRLHRQDVPAKEIARALGCHPSTVRYHTDPTYRTRKNTSRSGQIKRRRDVDREVETVRRLQLRGGPMQEAHAALADIEDALARAKDESRSTDERRDIQRAIDSVIEAKHWLARAIRFDLDVNRRPKVKHASQEWEAA